MINDNDSHVHLLFEVFQTLPYDNKLHYFDRYFNIIPFLFPKIDAEISWFADEAKLAMLTENFYKEIRSQGIYERTFTEADTEITFDIKPTSPSQRSQYNEFLVTKFLSADYSVFTISELNSKLVDVPVVLLRSKIKKARQLIEQIRVYLQSRKTKSDLKHQFLRVFYTGFTNFYLGKKISLSVRHKFVEIYLYSQGTFIAGYINHLQHLIEENDLKISEQVS